MADQAGVPQITNTGQPPPGFTFVHQSDPGAIASDFGGHTFYIAPTNAAATAGAGPQNQSQAGGGLRNYQTVGVDPNQPLTNLGAAALQQNAVYNPQPGAGTGGDTGVTGSGGSGFAGGGGLTIGGISTQQPRITTSGVVPKAPTGPWSNVPSLFNKATAMQPTAPLPVTPTPQATGMAYQPGQSWATPPPAPGITFGGGSVPMPMGGGQMGSAPQNWQGAGQVPPSGIPSGIGAFAAAHNSALADAGQALFAHYGGDPSSASPADIAHFHTQLTGVISGSISPGATALQTGGGGGKEPIKMQSGGWVPGDPNDNTDSVRARLSPGEYVIPKGQASENQYSGFSPEEQAYLQGQIAATQGDGVNPNLQVSSGKGVGQGVRRPLYERPGAIGASGQQALQYAETTPMTEQTWRATQEQPKQPQRPPPPAPQPNRPIDHSGQSSSAQDYADWANQGGPMGGKAGAVYDANGNLVTSSGDLTAQAAAGSGATMMPGGGIRDASGLVYDSSANLAAQDVGGAGATMPGAGGAGAGAAGAASAIGGIGSAVAKAAQTYADSIKGWQMQKSAIPNPDDFRKQPQITLQQPRLV